MRDLPGCPFPAEQTCAMGRSTYLLFLTIAYRDLRTRMRNRRSLIVVTLYLGLMGLVAVVFLLQQGDPAGQESQTGPGLFTALCITQLCLILFVTPASMAGAVSGERQRRTWDLLRLTGLSSFDIVFGKLLAGVILNGLLLVAPLPVYAAAFLSGGVRAVDLLRAGAVLLATILLLASLTLIISTLGRRPVVCLLVGNAASLLLGLGLSVLVLYLEVTRSDAGWALLGELGSLPANTPPLSTVAQIDPLAALLTALPAGNGKSLLGGTGQIPHALGLSTTLPVYGVFIILALILTLLFAVLSTMAVHWGASSMRG